MWGRAMTDAPAWIEIDAGAIACNLRPDRR
jgi:hypothetical protein